MLYAKLKTELLGARDQRQRTLAQVFAPGRTTVTLGLNIPGCDKQPAGSLGLFDWGRQLLSRVLPSMHEELFRLDALGPFAVLTTPLEADQTKQLAVAVERLSDFARLLDIDIFDPGGAAVDRRSLALEPRFCLLCPRPAVECIRLGAHSSRELHRRTHELLAPFASR